MNTVRATSSSDFDNQTPLTRLEWLLLGLLAVLLLGHLLTLTIYPSVFIDEGWLANTTWSWLKTGINFDTIHAGVLDQFGYEWVTDNFLGQMPYVLMYNFFGLGLFQARLVSWIFGVILIVATILVCRRCYSLRTGLVAALLLALSMPFLQSSRWRQDIILAAVIMVSFRVALYALDTNKIWAHLLAGFLMGVGFDIHQTSFIFIPGLAALYLAYYGKKFLTVRGTWIVGIGGALGLGYYAINHMLQNYEVYTKLMSFYFISGAEAQIPIMNPGGLVESAVRELARYRFRDNFLDFGMIVVGALALLYRRSKMDRLVLVFTGVTFASFILLSGDKTPLYAINLYPFFMIIAAEGLLSLTRTTRWKAVAWGAGIVLVAFGGFALYRTASLIYTNREYNYYDVTNEIRAVVPADKRIMGMPTWWLGLAEYDYRSSLSLTYYNFFNNYDVRQSFDAIHPDYVIVDGTQQTILVEEGQELVPGMNVYRISREQFMQVLEEQGEMVLEFTNPWHGNFQVYRLDWPEEASAP